MALLGLLLYTFRRIERWLHEHIFKVGWLLTNDFQTTTVLYYIIFLPGILLHEISLWLAAGVLNVRAERAIKFPERQEIGELRLNFIRLSTQTGAFRLFLITLTPLAAGLAALWAIAAHIFDWQATLGIAAPGAVDDLARAMAAFTRTADFWLWFYLAFTIANTMFPSLPKKLSAGQRSGLAIALPTLALLLWRVGGTANPSIAAGIEGLVHNLGLVTLQITLINIAVVIALGCLEAMIERLTGKSATFRDGKMITWTRQEAQQLKQREKSERQSARAAQETSQDAPEPTSIYELKLPIPGPPGREPISRSIAAVVSPQQVARDSVDKPPPTEDSERGAAPVSESKNRRVAAPPVKPPLAELARSEGPENGTIVHGPPAAVRKTDESGSGTVSKRELKDAGLANADNAPFSRPFVSQESPDELADSALDDPALTQDEPFARPFVMTAQASSRSADETDAPPSASPQHVIDSSASEGTQDYAVETDRRPTAGRQTRPAPKPSQRVKANSEEATDLDDGQLKYEALEDGDD